MVQAAISIELLERVKGVPSRERINRKPVILLVETRCTSLYGCFTYEVNRRDAINP